MEALLPGFDLQTASLRHLGNVIVRSSQKVKLRGAQFSATPAFIKSINADADVSLVFHVGDIHSGQQKCTLEYDQSIYNAWNGLQPAAGSGLPTLVNPTAFRFPVVYTPGDNEWTDCQKANESRPPKPCTADPIVNLGWVRSIFFANPGHTLVVDKPVWSQHVYFDSAYPTDAQYVKNVIWEQSGLVFVTLNLPGGSNNDEDNWLGATDQPAALEALIWPRISPP